ncbi:MAG: DUF4037 domain-containing protein [Chloroflexi bacterium]|nr:DUF4037 domain-containing protein [Chloroflexota bacterium]MCI0576103.1 DUF4037 domain-containing protein [Chloroflexota bacterium]MCI0647891.1 DUF4037 domain-containing protein [Chloroflexota bacterium]MCI0727142.1 DUF4037 domain-containing protein [Chloroflexota bacterium]
MTFIPGLKLCEQFYWEAVRPILDVHFPGLRHAAGRLDSGSEVLGFDDAMSTDHDWGPRFTLFLDENDYDQAVKIHDTLAQYLPYEFRGYPTNFSPPDPEDNNTQLLRVIEDGPVNHRVPTETVRGFFGEYLGFDIEQPLEAADWLTFPEQKLRTITGGAVYCDGIGLEEVRSRFTYYPRDVWLYLLAAGWARIGQEEHLMGRSGLAGDEVGSALIGARLVRDVMRLCFLMERTYAPYPKWFGTAFKQLAGATGLWPVLQRALAAESWQEREQQLIQAYETLATMHNRLQLTERLPEQTTNFFNRPFQVIALHGFAEALVEQIQDPAVKRLAERPLIGSLDQFSDSTDLVSDARWRPMLRQLYR